MSACGAALGCKEECEHSKPPDYSLPFSPLQKKIFAGTPTLLLWQVGRGREVGVCSGVMRV